MGHFICFPTKQAMFQLTQSGVGTQLKHQVIGPSQITSKEDKIELQENLLNETKTYFEEGSGRKEARR